MTANLVPGQNCPLPARELTVKISAGGEADFSAFLLNGAGKTERDEDFIFYGQTAAPGGALTLSPAGSSASFEVNLSRLSKRIEKIAFTVTSDQPSLAGLGWLDMEISDSGGVVARCEAKLSGRPEGALIGGEIYKRGDQWKFRYVDQGFNGGLKPLAEHFGVDIAADAPPPPEKKVSLSKISLTKNEPRVDLEKKKLRGGAFRVNLNWRRGKKKSGWGAFFGRGSGGIDLDLGAYVRTKDGAQTIVQALGDTFGFLERFPYVKLMGDDRTGDQAEGEWIYINGDKIDLIDEIIIYTFIYEGVPNWSETDAEVKIQIDGQPEIGTRLTGRDNSLPMAAIARIANKGGVLRVERLDQYFRGHKDMDKAFGWGFRWEAGRK